MTINKITSLYMILFTLTQSVQCFHISNCGSNKLVVVKQDKISNKAVIRFDKSVKVSIPKAPEDPPQIWCKSDCWFRQCILKHRKLDGYEETKCKWSSEENSLKKGSCGSYDYEVSANYDLNLNMSCAFTFNSITKRGMLRILFG